MELVFVSELPPADVGPGKGRPGVSRVAFTKPTARQPNRGLTENDPEFTCTLCHKVKPMEENYRTKTSDGSYRLTGRCRPCSLQWQRDANNRQAAKRRGPNYVLPVSRESLSPVVDGCRQCSDCGETKKLSLFYVDKTVLSGHQTSCKSCRSLARVTRWSELSSEDKQLIMDEDWIRRVWLMFCLTPSDYFTMLEAQGGTCAICHQFSKSRLSIDHDHKCCSGQRSCGKCVRKLLCTVCNFTVGGIERVGSTDPFAEYLAAHVRVCDAEDFNNREVLLVNS